LRGALIKFYFSVDLICGEANSSFGQTLHKIDSLLHRQITSLRGATIKFHFSVDLICGEANSKLSITLFKGQFASSPRAFFKDLLLLFFPNDGLAF